MSYDAKLRIIQLSDSIHSDLYKLQQLKKFYPMYKVEHSLHPGSVLNAYREGDVSFSEAVILLQEWANNRGSE